MFNKRRTHISISDFSALCVDPDAVSQPVIIDAVSSRDLPETIEFTEQSCITNKKHTSTTTVHSECESHAKKFVESDIIWL